MLLAIETGMRRSEILRIEWNNVNIAERFIYLPDTKNGESRIIPLSLKAIAVLESLLKDNGKVFSSKPCSITQAFNRACKRAGIKDLRFHDLRHEATSRLFEKGLNVIEVSSITGHKTLSMLKRYTHLDVKKLASKLN